MTTTTVDISTPSATDESRPSQRIETRWQLREEDGETTFAVLSTFHRGGGHYASQLYVISEERRDGFRCVKFAPFSSLLVFKTQAGVRFSVKSLRSVHESALGVLADMLKYDEQVAPYFDEDATHGPC